LGVEPTTCALRPFGPSADDSVTEPRSKNKKTGMAKEKRLIETDSFLLWIELSFKMSDYTDTSTEVVAIETAM
jgi:hypothetical protein